MTFESVITQTASSAVSQHHTLTDGQLTAAYQDMPGLFSRMGSFLAQNGVSRNTCLALECANSVPGALSLLYFLHQGQRFVLLPPAGGKGKDFDFKPLVPGFCQYVVRMQSDSVTDLWEPETFLELEKHDIDQPKEVVAELNREILYLRTSGSVGVSKITVHAHAKLLSNALNCVKRFRLQADDRVMIPVPIFHMYGLGAGFLPSVIAGACIDLQEQSNILKYLTRERQFNPNVAYLTPVLCDMFIRGRRTSRPHKIVVTAGQRINDDTFRAFDDRFGPLVNLYGSTELGAIAAGELDAPQELRATTIGKPMPDVDIRLDNRGMETEADERIGALYCRHAYGFNAYVDDTGKTVSEAANWFPTGDMAQQLENGDLKVLGRADHSINRRGYLVLFSEIEKAMEAIEDVERVVVVAVAGDGQQEQRLVVFCQTGAGAALSGTDIRSACFKVLPNYAIPDRVVVVETLPSLPSGKVDRQTLTGMASELERSPGVPEKEHTENE